MRNTIPLLFLALLSFACEKNQSSGDVNLTNFTVTDLNRSSFNIDQIYQDDSARIIYLLFSNSLPLDSFPIQFTADFDLAGGASSEPASGETSFFSSMDNRIKYTITAEDGSKADYYVVLRDNQLPNNGFEDWYTTTGMNGAPYSEPGKSALTTVWATANHGTSIYGVYCTKAVTDGDNTLAEISTGATSIPITAGTLFTGTFDINGAINNPTDPRKATHFGIPFSLRPNSLKFKYTYQPGASYIKATLNDPSNIFGGFTVTPVAGNDMFTAYAILEARTETGVVEVGRAEITSGDVQSELKQIALPFEYSSSQKPTHISVVFSSSKDGDLFTGAVGSTLTIDDIELVY